MTDDEAMAIALRALTRLLHDSEQTSRLIAETGLDPGGLAARAMEPAFLGAILDFLLGHEPTLLEFCRAEALSPDRVHRARATLPGGPGAWSSA